jgi:hypothetical protein
MSFGGREWFAGAGAKRLQAKSSGAEKKRVKV